MHPNFESPIPVYALIVNSNLSIHNIYHIIADYSLHFPAIDTIEINSRNAVYTIIRVQTASPVNMGVVV